MQLQSEHARIFALDENGKLLAEITFPEISPGVFDMNHTFVSPSLRGQGVANTLVEQAVAQIRAQNGRAKATCPYVVRWFSTRPEEADLLVRGTE